MAATGAGKAQAMPQATAAVERAAGRRVLPRLLVLLVAASAALWPTVASLEAYWRSMSDYHHGYLVVLLVGAWLVVCRNELEAASLRPVVAPLALLALLLACWLVAWRGESLMLAQLAWPAVLAVAVWAGCGAGVARLLLPAFAYLYFATPIWDHLVPVLQFLTVFASERMLAVVGIPFEVDGNFITLRDGTFEIAEGCAGKRYFVVTLAVAMAASIVERFPLRRFLLLMLLAAVLAILMNWLRVVAIIVVGHATAMQHYLVAVEHETFGWVLFGLLLAGVLVLAHLHRPADEPAGAPSEPAEPVTSARRGAARWWWPLPVLAVPLAWHIAAADGRPIAPRLGALPVLTGTWQGPFPPGDGWAPRFVGAADELRAAYGDGSGRIEIYINVYGTQRPEVELIGYANSLAGQGWGTLEPATLGEQLASFGPSSQPLYLLVGKSRREPWVVGRVYRVGGHAVAADLSAQVTYGAMSLAGPVPAGVLAFAAACEGDCGRARARLETFWRDVGAKLLDIIPVQVAESPNCSKLPVAQGLGENC